MSEHPYLFDMPEAVSVSASEAVEKQRSSFPCELVLAEMTTELTAAGIQNAYGVVEAIKAGRVPTIALLAGELIDELEHMVAQYGCSCGHMACRRCLDTESARAAIARHRGRYRK